MHGGTVLILPTLGRTDRDLIAGRKQMVSVEDSMSMVHPSRGGLEPPSTEVRSEVEIVCWIARAALGPATPGCRREGFAADYDTIQDEIAAVIPGCADYNCRVREPDGFQMPHPPRETPANSLNRHWQSQLCFP